MLAIYSALTAGYNPKGEVAQSCPTLCDPVDCNLLGFSVHGILQARILEWIAISFSRGSSPPRDRTQVSRIGGKHFNLWATRECIIQDFNYSLIEQWKCRVEKWRGLKIVFVPAAEKTVLILMEYCDLLWFEDHWNKYIFRNIVSFSLASLSTLNLQKLRLFIKWKWRIFKIFLE